MGRNFPLYNDHNHRYKDHPFLYISLLIACITATIAIVSFLCGSLSRKKPPGAPVEDETLENHENSESDIPTTKEEYPHNERVIIEESSSNNKKESRKDRRQKGKLPNLPPPGRSSSCHVRSQSTPMTMGKLESSVSMRAWPSRRGENSHHKRLKHEDSIWKKTIILGEKCRVPDEDDEAIVYDEKGNRISTYHPRTKSNAFESLSRQTSRVDLEPQAHATLMINNPS